MNRLPLISLEENVDLNHVRRNLKSPLTPRNYEYRQNFDRKIQSNENGDGLSQRLTKDDEDKENTLNSSQKTYSNKSSPQKKEEIDFKSQQSKLIEQYSKKNRELNIYKQRVNQIQFELNEISINLENLKSTNDIKNGNIYNEDLVSPIRAPVKKQQSMIFKALDNASSKLQNQSIFNEDLIKKTKTFNDDLKKKASTLFNNDLKVFNDDLKKKANNIFNDDFNLKTTQFFNDIKSTLSPNKPKVSDFSEYNDSFSSQTIFEQSEAVDIDDYSSDDDNNLFTIKK